MYPKLSEFRLPKADDILFVAQPTMLSDVIVLEGVKRNPGRDEVVLKCDVLKVGREVTEVNEGDTIFVDFLDKTNPFFVLDDSGNLLKVFITDQSRVMAVIE